MVIPVVGFEECFNVIPYRLDGSEMGLFFSFCK